MPSKTGRKARYGRGTFTPSGKARVQAIVSRGTWERIVATAKGPFGVSRRVEELILLGLAAERPAR